MSIQKCFVPVSAHCDIENHLRIYGDRLVGKIFISEEEPVTDPVPGDGEGSHWGNEDGKDYWIRESDNEDVLCIGADKIASLYSEGTLHCVGIFSAEEAVQAKYISIVDPNEHVIAVLKRTPSEDETSVPAGTNEIHLNCKAGHHNRFELTLLDGIAADGE